MNWAQRASRLSFRSWLTIGTAIWSLILVSIAGVAIFLHGRSSEASVIDINLRERLLRGSFRVNQLLRSAELTVESAANASAPFDPRDNEAWAQALLPMLPVLEQRPEIVRLTYRDATTGLAGAIMRAPDGDFIRTVPESNPTAQTPPHQPQPPGRTATSSDRTLNVNPVIEQLPPPAQPASNALPYWSAVHPLTPEVDAIGISYVSEVRAPNGTVRGHWWADFDLGALQRFMTDLYRETGLRTILTDHSTGQARPIGHFDETAVSSVRNPTELELLPTFPLGTFAIPPLSTGQTPPLPSKIVNPHYFDHDGDRWVGGEVLVGHEPARWSLSGALPRSLALPTRLGSTPAFLLVALVGFSLTLALSTWLAAVLAKPVESLSRAVALLDQSREIPPLSGPLPRELTELRETLKLQYHRLSNRQHELIETNAELQHQIARRRDREATLAAIFDNTPFDIWTTNKHGVYTFQNAFSRRIYGNIVGRNLVALEAPPGLIRDRQSRLEQVLRGEVSQRDLLEITPAGPKHFHILEAPIIDREMIVGALGVKIDLTEQRRAEEALRISQQRISRHLENSPLGVIDFDTEFRINSWNASAENIFGWKASEIIGRLGNTIVPTEERPDMLRAWQEITDNGAASQHFNQNLTRDGRLIECEWYNTPIIDGNGAFIGVSSLVLDVSERMAAERLFRESEERFHKAFHSSPAPQAIVSYPDLRFIDLNPSWSVLLGYDHTDAIDRTDAELGIWSDLADRRAFLLTIARGESFAPTEVQLRHRDDSIRHVLLSAARVRVAERDCVIVSLSDLTERIAAELNLRQGRQFLRTLVDQLPGMSFRCLIDADRTMLWVSHGSVQLCGYSPTEFTEKTVSFGDLILPEYQTLTRETVQRATNGYQSSRTYVVEYELHHHDGSRRWMWERGEIVRNPSSHTDEIVGFITDVTAQKRSEQALRDLNETLELRVAARTAELEAANQKLHELGQLKTEFLATMSHELRTPLNSIIGFSSILERGMVGPLLPEQKLQLGLVCQSARHLLELINNLLDVSRIDSGRFEFNREVVDLGSVLQTVETDLRTRYDFSRVTYRNVLPSAALSLISDRRRLTQIISNLAGNAVKFTPGPNGLITVTIRMDSNDRISIEIQDNGIGIKAEHLPQLFEAFHQVDASARRIYEGVGLGLNLVRKLTAKLGGTVTVESTFGSGSTFTVTLPLLQLPS